MDCLHGRPGYAAWARGHVSKQPRGDDHHSLAATSRKAVIDRRSLIAGFVVPVAAGMRSQRESDDGYDAGRLPFGILGKSDVTRKSPAPPAIAIPAIKAR